MHVLKKLARETVVYGLSSIVGRVLNYLLVPLYTSILLPSEYGIVTEFYAYAAFGNILYTLGLETAYFRFASQEKNRNIFNICISLLMLTSLCFSIFLISFATPLINWLHYPGYERYIYYYAAILATDSLSVIPFAQLRLEKKAFSFASIKLFQIGLNIILNVLLLYWDKMIIREDIARVQIVEWIFIANLLSNLAIFPCFWQHFARFRFQFSKQKLQQMLIYSFPLLLMGLAGTANEMLSRILLKYLLPPDFYPGYSKESVLGIFGACYKLAVFMNLAIQAFRYAAEPFFFRHAQDKDAPKLFGQIMQAYVIVSCFILFAITANLDWLSYLFLRNPVYREGIEIVPYLLFAYLWLGVYYNSSIWFKVTDKTYYGPLITGVGVFITGILNILLVPYWGYWGCVVATVISYLTMSILSYYQGQKYYLLFYPSKRMLVYILITISLVPFMRNIHYVNWYTNIVINLAVTILVGLFLYQLNYRNKYPTENR